MAEDMNELTQKEVDVDSDLHAGSSDVLAGVQQALRSVPCGLCESESRS